jgi:oligosaccharide repeat unit polymerase
VILLLLSILAAGFAYLLFYKPEWIAVALFTMIISSYNLQMQGMPMNLRAIISFALLLRIMADNKTHRQYITFFGLTSTLLLLGYLAYTCLVNYWQDLFTAETLKQRISAFIGVYCAFHFYYFKKNADLLKYALILSGFLCFLDLAYTYLFFGTFPVRRVLEFLTVSEVVDYGHEGFYNGANHNFFGQITGMTFLLLITEAIKKHPVIRKLLFLAPLMLLSVALSTSRSSIFAVIIGIIYCFYLLYKTPEQRKMIMRMTIWSGGSLALIFLLFFTLRSFFHLEGNFADELMLRLVDEPTAMLKKSLGQSYDIQNLSSMDWREEASANAYASYSKLNIDEQLFGIGQDGFILRNLGNGLNPHNGIMIILIEYGLVGFLMYLILFLLIVGEMRRVRNSSSALFMVILFVVIYGLPQNNELTSTTLLLFMFSLVAENRDILQRKDTGARQRKLLFKYKDRSRVVSLSS